MLVSKLITFALVLLALSKVQSFNTFHPPCSFVNRSEPFFDHIEDITAFLHGEGQTEVETIPSNVCVFNPSVLHYKDDIYLWTARTYTARDSVYDCHTDPASPRPLMGADRGSGDFGFLLAASRTRFHGRNHMTNELLGLRQYSVRLEDPRLFKDHTGAIWMMSHYFRGADMSVESIKVQCDTGTYYSNSSSSTRMRDANCTDAGTTAGCTEATSNCTAASPNCTNCTGGAATAAAGGGLCTTAEARDGGGGTAAPVTCSKRSWLSTLFGWRDPKCPDKGKSEGPQLRQRMRCSMTLGGIQILYFKGALSREKNWVPHNGTTRMSYPIYRTFGPHKGFDFGSFQHPSPKADFDFVAPMQPFFEKLLSTFKGEIELAGSTPAVLYDDNVSYIAVGHLRANPYCFHSPRRVTWYHSICHAAMRGRIQGKRAFSYTWDGKTMHHHGIDYAFFLYRFTAEPPYQITHISHAFVPCTHIDSGIVFPAGLDRIGPVGDYLISYGEEDRYSRIAVLSRAKAAMLLQPIEEMANTVKSYTLCTMPCP